VEGFQFFLKDDLISEDICTAGFNSLGYLRVCRVRIRHLYLRQGLGFRVLGLGFTVYGLGFRVYQGLGFRVQG
jgi:hypothetical protein